MKNSICSLGVITILLLLTVPALALEHKTYLERDKSEERVHEGNSNLFIYGATVSSEDKERLTKANGSNYLNSEIAPSGNALRFTLENYQSQYGINQRFYNSQHIKPEDKPSTSKSLDFEFTAVAKGSMGTGIIDVGAALFTEVLLHEIGHAVVADYVGAEGSNLDFLTSRDGQFFLGSSTVTAIDDRSRLPYNMGGEVAADFTFEYALGNYRKNPSLYNKALMLFSGTDLLRYSLYAFVLSDGHDHLDPIAVTKYSGISKEAVISVALLKTALNAYRIHSGSDTIIPHFTLDKDSVILNLTMSF